MAKNGSSVSGQAQVQQRTGSSGTSADQGSRYELRFGSISVSESAYRFPCDCAGHVDIDALSDIDRLDYLYARTLIGRDFRAPAVHSGADD